MKLQMLALKAGDAEQLLRSLANRSRLMILCELLNGELSVGELQARIGLSQSALSQHLARLRSDELVKTRRETQSIYYSVSSDHALRVIALLHDLYCRKADTSARSNGGKCS